MEAAGQHGLGEEDRRHGGETALYEDRGHAPELEADALRGRIAAAAADLAKDMNTYDGVKYVQIMEEVYKQGRKDGAAAAFDSIDKGVKAARQGIPHRNPGQPKKHS